MEQKCQPRSRADRQRSTRFVVAILIAAAPVGGVAACGSSSSSSTQYAPPLSHPDGGGSGSTKDGSGGPSGLDGSQARASCPAQPYAKQLSNLVYEVAKHMQDAGTGSLPLVNLPSTADRDTFAAQVIAALKFDGSDPCPLPPSYIVMSLVDGPDEVRVVGEFDKYGTAKPALYWGAYAARRPGTGTRSLVIESAHPVADPDTDLESARVFTATRAEWYLLAGSHRCANPTVSGCDGTTAVCTPGKQSPYKESDAAHSTKTPFHGVHMAVSSATTAPFLQLHSNGETCPAALLSDCSGTFPASGPTFTFGKALEAAGVTVGRCGSGFPTAACSLCGTENVQARFNAGAGDACTMQGTTYGRFIHLEQQQSLVTTTGDAPLITAINATFPPR